MSEIVLSKDIVTITAEINSYKQVAGQAVFEIGKRLKHVRDGLKYGDYDTWCENNLGFTRRTANRFIQSFEQFGTTSPQLETGKMFEMLSLPESVDRHEFINKPHAIPSTGVEKTVDEMTVKELREVKKKLKENEELLETTKASAEHWQKVAQSAQNMPPRIETRTVEVVPESIKRKMEEDEFKIRNLQTGYQDIKNKLQQFEMKETVDFNQEQSDLQRKKLQHEADMETIHISVLYKNFIEKAALGSYQYGAVANADQLEKRRLLERIEIAEKIIKDTKLALSGRKIGVVNE